MTAQISNIFKIGEKEFDIVGLSDDLHFSPRDYGLKPVALHTGAVSGYHYEANIIDGQLVVQNLYVNDYDGNYPDILGVYAVDKTQETGMYFYENVNIPLEFTGKMLIGHGFIRKYYEHMGYQRPHAYEELMILTFRDGMLLDQEDISDKAQMVRDNIDCDPEGYKERQRAILTDYIEKSFSLNIDKEYM